MLGSLPARATGDEAEATIDRAAYYLALDGTTQHGLFEAVKAILKGALGHAFFPNPAELRMQCDRAMQHHAAMRERIERRQRALAERPADRPPLTDEERERQRERMARFHASYKPSEQDELAAIRSKYDPELLAKIPDAPLPKGWTQVGRKSA